MYSTFTRAHTCIKCRYPHVLLLKGGVIILNGFINYVFDFEKKTIFGWDKFTHAFIFILF